MTTHKITPAQLPASILREARKVTNVLPRAAMAGARRFAATLVNAYDAEDITYQGILKNSVRAVSTGRGATVLVDAPHAGIIELGARPHPVSREGVEAIARWVFLKLHAVQGPSKKTFDEKSGKFRTTVPKDRRKQISVRREGPVREVNGKRKGPGSYKVGYDEASLQIAYAIAQKIKREGQKPKYVVKRHLPLASQYVAEECERLLRGAS